MKTALFICVNNAGRIQMAEAFFNSMTEGKATAISAGSQPADTVNPTVVAAMKEEGIDIRQNKPKLLLLEMMGGIDKAITKGCENSYSCPLTTVETEHLGLANPSGKTIARVRKIRDEVKERVAEHIKQMTI